MYKPSIMIVEPEVPLRNRLLDSTRHRGYPIVTAHDGLQALVLMRFMAEHTMDLPLVITNVDLPVVDHPSLDHALEITGLDLTMVLTGVADTPNEKDIVTYLFDGDHRAYAEFKAHYQRQMQPTNILLLTSPYVDREAQALISTINHALDNRRTHQRVGSASRNIALNQDSYFVNEDVLRLAANVLLPRPLDPYSGISAEAHQQFANRVSRNRAYV